MCFAREGEFEDIIELLTKDVVNARMQNLSNPDILLNNGSVHGNGSQSRIVDSKGDVDLDELDTNDDLMFAIRTATENSAIPEDDSFSFDEQDVLD